MNDDNGDLRVLNGRRDAGDAKALLCVKYENKRAWANFFQFWSRAVPAHVTSRYARMWKCYIREDSFLEDTWVYNWKKIGWNY